MKYHFLPPPILPQTICKKFQAEGKEIKGLETRSELNVFFERDLDTLYAEIFAELKLPSEAHEVNQQVRKALYISNTTLDDHSSDKEVAARNQSWLPKLEEMDSDYLICVGCFHLFGDNGLLQLLQSDGYNIEQMNHIGAFEGCEELPKFNYVTEAGLHEFAEQIISGDVIYSFDS